MSAPDRVAGQARTGAAPSLRTYTSARAHASTSARIRPTLRREAVRAPSVRPGTGLLLLGAAAALGACGWLLRPRAPRSPLAALKPRSHVAGPAAQARRLHRAAGTLATCVLFDSAIEHYRGNYHNRGMFAPLASAALTIGASTSGGVSRGVGAGGLQRSRALIYALAGGTGLVGLAFHLYNIGKRIGGFSWLNFFYAAPVAAPAALAFAGVLGAAANRLHEQSERSVPRLLGIPAGRVLAALTSAGLLGTVGEVALLHFRGAFQNPAMYLPVSVPPVAAVLLAKSAATGSGGGQRAARWWLRLTGVIGLLGTLFHAYGVGRAMGGWRNWSQNLLNGPPIPAPPSFTALALSGLSALDLMKGDAR